MKRTTLVLDEVLLKEAQRISGERTYSATVARALDELVRRAKARRILELEGSGVWKGNLGEMRDDAVLRPPRAPGPPRAARRAVRQRP
jgi:Arc/MetJ family transcription regulator